MRRGMRRGMRREEERGGGGEGSSIHYQFNTTVNVNLLGLS